MKCKLSESTPPTHCPLTTVLSPPPTFITTLVLTTAHTDLTPRWLVNGAGTNTRVKGMRRVRPDTLPALYMHALPRQVRDSDFFWNRVTMKRALERGAEFAAKRGDQSIAETYRLLATEIGNKIKASHTKGPSNPPSLILSRPLASSLVLSRPLLTSHCLSPLYLYLHFSSLRLTSPHVF